ncbi:Uncharacterised protein [Achromobacter xylosoxidans]|nr:Uncharacterised protein [Achromobacter xylosoxidans]CUJ71647.1 Uncharacterised protein [Achromobacter xylosoxidans]
MALSGLALVLYQSLTPARPSNIGIGFAVGALLCMTFGA